MRLMWLVVVAVLAVGSVGLGGMVGLGGCAAKQEPKGASAPSWINGASGYSSAAYLVGIGSGATQQVAADRARSDLAKAISVSVESAEQSKTSASVGEYDSSFSSSVFTRANRTIEGVEIADRYYDEAHDLHYALAILDRHGAGARLRSEIAQMQLEIDEQLALADRQAGALQKLKLLNGAEKLLGERRAAASVLSVVGGGGTSAPAYINDGSIRARKIAAIAAIRFAVSGDGEAKKLLSESLSLLGFTIAGGGGGNGNSGSEAAGFEAIGSSEKSVRYERGWQWAKAAIDVRIVDRRNGAIVGAYRFEAEESAQNIDIAKERALRSLRSRLDKELIEKLTN
ncbi:hypothetical protein FACS189487_00880 [Campylobacterota bacterium]|nr:hypothetical protein FACS189487_00880 [Campylobacterota bacterium]